MLFQTKWKPNARLANSGFTLIELMIVVAIIGILAAIALPAYTDYVRKGNRASARTVLLETQQFMERYYAANSRYSKAADGAEAPTLPDRLTKAPTDSPKYTISVSAIAVNSYTLTATPLSTDATCGNLTLTNTGTRGQSAGDLAKCWK